MQKIVLTFIALLCGLGALAEDDEATGGDEDEE